MQYVIKALIKIEKEIRTQIERETFGQNRRFTLSRLLDAQINISRAVQSLKEIVDD